MTWQCDSCGHSLESVPTDSTSGRLRCPKCSAEVKLAAAAATPAASAEGETVTVSAEELAARAEPESATPGDGGPSFAPEEDSVETVFQPVLMVESIMDELRTKPAGEQTGHDEPGTETLETDPSALPSPFLEIDVEAFLLLLGAAPGQEKRPLIRAKTTFGRRGADVELDDAAVSGLHFQIEAFGKEFFLRDLDSRNGTFLNGTKVRYSQLLPGDQVTAGKTTLIFRTSDDLIDRD